MWLLNTSSGRLKQFNDSSLVKYAILSHCWRDNEQTFQDTEALARAYPFPRQHASSKIRECCLYAEREGYEWVWIDSCCIDKTSSTALDEAINSMYAWYAEAAVCYTSLDDVQTVDVAGLRKLTSAFRRSRWWTRGWTLQELIAPSHLVFLSQTREYISSKSTIADVVEEISGVDREVLLGVLSLDDISVARRMSWASRRCTTRKEDRAYSLMGIFDVNMTIIYGEQGRAFIRLQEEIIKNIPDQSIFAWGPIMHDYPFSCKGFASELPSEHLIGESMYDGPTCVPYQTLFAPSPDEFGNAGAIRPISITNRQYLLNRLAMKKQHHTFTSYGVCTQLPLFRYRMAPHISLSAPVYVPVAVLACEDEQRRLVVLILRRKGLSHLQNEYFVGDFASPTLTSVDHRTATPVYVRAAMLVSNSPIDGLLNKTREVYIHNRPHFRTWRRCGSARVRGSQGFHGIWAETTPVRWDDMTYGITHQDIAYLAIVVAMSKVNSIVVYVMGFLLALHSWHHKTFGQLPTSRQLVFFEADWLDHVRAQLFTDGDVP